MKSLYIVECKTKDAHYHYIKVGISTNTEKRVKQMQTGCPFPLTVLQAYDYIINEKGLERAIHSKYITKCVIGEWFKFRRNDLPTVLRQIDEFVNQIGRKAIDNRPKPLKIQL